MYKCPSCGSEKNKKHSVRKNKVESKKVLRCLDCGKYFSAGDEMLRFRHSKDKIEVALRMRRTGFSLAETVKYLKDLYGVEVSRQTVLYWEKKFKDNESTLI